MKNLFRFALVLSVLLGIGSNRVAFAAYSEGSAAHHLEEHDGPASNPVTVLTLVRYANADVDAPPITAGDVVIWNFVSDDGVTIDLAAASTDAVAGISVGTIPTAETMSNTAVQDLGKRNWGYIQIYGYYPTCKIDGTTIAAGGGLRASPTARRATTSNATGLIQSGANGGSSLGFAYDASSAQAESAEVFVRTR